MIETLKRVLRIENKLVSLLLPILWMGVIFYLSSIPNLQFSGSLAPFDYFFRTVAHIVEYAILAFLWRRNLGKIETYTVAGLYAVFDEVHQSFVLSRSGQVSDVTVDAVGIWIGQMLYQYVHKNRNNS